MICNDCAVEWNIYENFYPAEAAERTFRGVVSISPLLPIRIDTKEYCYCSIGRGYLQTDSPFVGMLLKCEEADSTMYTTMRRASIFVFSLNVASGESRISQRNRTPNYYLAKCCWKLHENERNWTGGRPFWIRHWLRCTVPQNVRFDYNEALDTHLLTARIAFNSTLRAKLFISKRKWWNHWIHKDHTVSNSNKTG